LDSNYEIRHMMKNKRNGLTKKIVESKSMEIFNRLINLDMFEMSNEIMCYVDFKNEVETRKLIEYCLKIGKKIAVPKTDNDGTVVMKAFYVYDLRGLVKGKLGILEPEFNVDNYCQPDIFDMVIAPALALDTEKNRLGYGAGFYDRYLKDVRSDCVKLGLVYDFQIVDKIDTKDHDVKMDFIISENRIIE
jgi:5-formyltetrahydrofolate cyclo-ligase